MVKHSCGISKTTYFLAFQMIYIVVSKCNVLSSKVKPYLSPLCHRFEQQKIYILEKFICMSTHSHDNYCKNESLNI